MNKFNENYQRHGLWVERWSSCEFKTLYNAFYHNGNTIKYYEVKAYTLYFRKEYYI